MLIPAATLAEIAAGRVDLAFRRWRRPTVKVGTRLRTAVGLVEIRALSVVDPSAITDTDARRAGYGTRAALLSALARIPEGLLYRVALRSAGPDPRIALRAELPSDREMVSLLAEIATADRRRGGQRVLTILQLIADRPAVRAADLAARLGRETRSFKADVRRLKEMGLTESLDVGYRLSPRGRAVLARLGSLGM